MKIAFLLYDGFTALDVVGPFEALYRLPDAEVAFVSSGGGLVQADARPLALASEPLSAAARPDVVVVPGGTYTNRRLVDEELLDWLRTAHAHSTWTTSVCTGALLLGAAGLLEGRRATTHWYELDSLAVFGAQPVAERVVQSGDVVTAAGVASGIDMALWLVDRIAGADYARGVQLAMEYDPDPPHATGSPASAPTALLEQVREVFRAGYGPTWAELSASAHPLTTRPRG